MATHAGRRASSTPGTTRRCAPIDDDAAVLRRAADDLGHRQRGRPQSASSARTTRTSSAIVFSPQILAKAVFADPELTLGLPPAVTAATGMDALTHNIESYLSPAYHPLCDGIALEGTRIAARALLHGGARAAATCRRAAT